MSEDKGAIVGFLKSVFSRHPSHEGDHKAQLEAAEPPPSEEPKKVRSAALDFQPFGPTARRFKIWGPTADGGVFHEIKVNGTFEPHLVRLARLLVKETDTVFDVGANIGAMTLVFSVLAFRGHVYAFEASVSSMNYLQGNLKENDISNVTPINRAVYDHSGENLVMHILDENLGGSFLSTVALESGRSEFVRSLMLDDFTAQGHMKKIDVIKMDVEGSELFALAGAEHILRMMKPLLFVECNAMALMRFHRKTAIELFNLLAKHYLNIYVIPNFDMGPALIVPIKTPAELEDCLAYGRGIDDLICSHQPLREDIVMPFKAYITTLKGKNGGRRIVLHPEWSLHFEERTHEVIASSGLYQITATLTNTSDAEWGDWEQNPIFIGYHLFDPSGEGELVSFENLKTGLGRSLAPGESMEIKLNVDIPEEPGFYHLYFSPVQEGIGWFDHSCDNVSRAGLRVIPF